MTITELLDKLIVGHYVTPAQAQEAKDDIAKAAKKQDAKVQKVKDELAKAQEELTAAQNELAEAKAAKAKKII